MAANRAHVILPLLVAIAAAAPLVEQTGERMVSLSGDSSEGGRAKRAKEEIVFGNQQNRAHHGAAKKSAEPEDPPNLPAAPVGGLLTPDQVLPRVDPPPPLDPAFDRHGFLDAQQQQPTADSPENPRDVNLFQNTPLEGGVRPQEEGQAGKKEEEEEGEEEEGQAGKKEEEEEAERKEEEEEPSTASQEEDSLLPEVPANEVPTGDAQSSEPEEEEEGRQSGEESELSPPQPPSSAAALESDMRGPGVPLLPPDSQSADAEESLQAQQPDEVEDFLDQFQHDQHEPGTEAEHIPAVTPGAGAPQGSPQMAPEEAELLGVSSGQQPEGEGEVAAVGADTEDYTQRLLKYILLNNDQYAATGRPAKYSRGNLNDYMALPPYYLRRRRSVLRRPLPRIQRRRRGSSDTRLARAKRAKRDLYYSDRLPYQPEPYQPEPEPEIRVENERDLQDLISYLMSLHPELYNQQPQLPGYLWYGANYPAPESELEPYSEWEEEEEPEYVEVPVGYEEAVPAWEPGLYPGEEEEGEYYPAAAKRQMLSMVPGQRRKRFFYPAYQEPYTHWGAFVPQQKRDTQDAYQRLKQLALVLAQSRQPPPPATQDWEYMPVYKRK